MENGLAFLKAGGHLSGKRGNRGEFYNLSEMSGNWQEVMQVSRKNLVIENWIANFTLWAAAVSCNIVHVYLVSF